MSIAPPMALSLQTIATWLVPGTLVGDASVTINRVHTDTRTVTAGDLFVALRGENFDANDFLQSAKDRGAQVAIAERGLQASGLNGIEVAHARIALGKIAKEWRAQFSIPLIAVTGSNGKTTVTQMLASILRAWYPNASLATQGSYNNDVGLPLTLLGLRHSHCAAVVEIGMNHPGEIAALGALAKPTVALVNNAQREHLEFMGTVAAVAAENASIFADLPSDGVAVFPADDVHTLLWRSLAIDGQPARRAATFALARDTSRADVTGDGIWHSGAWHVTAHSAEGKFNYRLRIAGKHNVTNSLAAAACALAAGAPLSAVIAGLDAFEAVKGRSKALAVTLGGRTITVIDDSYNANPDSVRAAIDLLAELPTPRVMVLGDMGEVGDDGPNLHREVGTYAQDRNIDHLLCLGDFSRHSAAAFAHGVHFDHLETLLHALDELAGRCGSILIKGSRFMRMERAVTHLQASAAPSPQERSAHVA